MVRKGYTYAGSQSTTSSGASCSRWARVASAVPIDDLEVLANILLCLELIAGQF